MKNTIEKEIWGQISEDIFLEKLKEIKKIMGEPKVQKRLAIQILDLDNKELWTRIRITDKKAEIMQKVGNWDEIFHKEISVEINSDLDGVWNHYLILRNLVSDRRCQMIAIEHINYIFESENFEIKLSKQGNKKPKYPFEIEAKKEDVDLIDISRKFGLNPDISAKGEDFWESWNREVNINLKTTSDEEIRNLIKKYI